MRGRATASEVMREALSPSSSSGGIRGTRAGIDRKIEREKERKERESARGRAGKRFQAHRFLSSRW